MHFRDIIFLYQVIILHRKLDGKRDRGRPKTSFVKQMIYEAEITIYTKLKRLAENK
jgi:hypothetical protein